MTTNEKNLKVMLGNAAIARGIVEASCEFATSYPGTPATEILEEIVKLKKEHNLNIFVEWAVNEKIAYDIAYSASICGKRSAVSMKQVGLNVASDTFLNSAYQGVKGGMVIIPCDDPGPHSSQTEQDSRLFAILAKVPVLDPSTPAEAKEMIKIAFDLSEEFEIPVMVRPTTRLCHGRGIVPLEEINYKNSMGNFIKEPSRWAATPRFRYLLHKKLNEKLQAIQKKFDNLNSLNKLISTNKKELGIIASGSAFATISDLMKDLNIEYSILKLGIVFPFPHAIVNKFIQSHKKILILEEPDFAIEIQVGNREKIFGRLNGYVPSEGELTPDVLYDILSKVDEEVKKDIIRMEIIEEKIKPPTLCAGCAHRAAFFAIRKSFPNAIFPSDIGCYTLGLNLKAVDTCIDMGASITMASGFYHALKNSHPKTPIIATIGDSTFLHSGIPALMEAFVNESKFVLVILDNQTVAMTGGQPTPASGFSADGAANKKVSIKKIIEGIGIEFIKEVDPYDISGLIKLVKEGVEYTKKEGGGIAVLIAIHPCVLHQPESERTKVQVEINEKCDGCKFCLKFFECPALFMENKRVDINRELCIDCGVCIYACPKDAIVKRVGV